VFRDFPKKKLAMNVESRCAQKAVKFAVSEKNTHFLTFRLYKRNEIRSIGKTSALNTSIRCRLKEQWLIDAWCVTACK